jgi:hypothetical protein
MRCQGNLHSLPFSKPKQIRNYNEEIIKGGKMIEDARAKIRLADGREVWRHVYIRYREVKTGRWLSSSEMERLWMREVQAPVKTDDKAEQIRNKIVDVQAEIAMDKAGGSKSTSAARVVLKALD